MYSEFDKPAIGFLFFPEHISSSVVDTARRTGVKAVFDLTGIDAAASTGALLQANIASDAVELKLSSDALLNPALPDFLRKTNITTIWVELHEALIPDIGALLEKISGLSDEWTIIPILGSVPLIRNIVENHPEIKVIALKGNEASGFVGSETIFILYAAVRQMIQDRDKAPALAIWGERGSCRGGCCIPCNRIETHRFRECTLANGYFRDLRRLSQQDRQSAARSY